MMKSYGWATLLLEKYMYEDSVTVSRQVNAVDEEGADIFVMENVYNHIPCKFAQSSADSSSTKTSGPFLVNESNKVLLTPTYTILVNDTLTVTRQDVDYVLYATKVFYYPSHVEVSVSEERDA